MVHRTNPWPLLIIVLLLVIGGGIAYRVWEKAKEKQTMAGQRAARGRGAASVAVAKAEARDIVGVFETTGLLETPEEVKIAAKTGGRLLYCAWKEGDTVRKGQLLAQLDPTDLEADLRKAEAAVAEARAKLAQAKANEKSTAQTATSQVAQQAAAVTTATADLQQATRNADAQQASTDAAKTEAIGKVASAQVAVENAHAAIASAEANRDNAREKYNRMKSLFEKKFVAAQEVDDARAALAVQESAVTVANGQLKSAKAGLETAKAQLASAELQVKMTSEKSKGDIEIAQAKLAQAEAALATAREQLAAQRPVYDESISALRQSVNAAEATRDSARAKLVDLTLTSPLDGVVTARLLEPGSVVSAGQGILTVQFVKRVWVSVAVPEEASQKTHLGQRVQVTLDALDGKPFPASIVQISPTADPQSRQFTVRAILENSDGRLKPGMYARVALETGRVKGAVAVPREAVMKEGEAAVVFVVTGEDTAERREVTVGASDATHVQIVSGVTLGEKVVTMSSAPLRDGQSVSTGGGRGGRPGGGGGRPGGAPGAPEGKPDGAGERSGGTGGGRPGGQTGQ